MQEVSSPTSLEQAFVANRQRLLRFLTARGAGDEAEDVLQDLWMRLLAAGNDEAAVHPSYMMRAADRLMIDRYRSKVQAAKRDRAWAETQPGVLDDTDAAPSAERVIAAHQHTRMVHEALDALGPRAATIFRRHRIDGIPQRDVAAECNVSLSTVESDLRRAYQALCEVWRRIDEG
ncbi:RNA polymerase sigma factor [Altererythrobacter sp. SALINAS58]|uniref:RNA polymerase sigma factor n=1 Tax=Alteripontixanthobacter muriae TaxID=2705546 RepID=UPI001575C6EE|nr:RNA polymerase sigma factor [Alteripontixanthobacter muriae]